MFWSGNLLPAIRNLASATLHLQSASAILHLHSPASATLPLHPMQQRVCNPASATLRLETCARTPTFDWRGKQQSCACGRVLQIHMHLHAMLHVHVHQAASMPSDVELWKLLATHIWCPLAQLDGPLLTFKVQCSVWQQPSGVCT